MSQLASFAFSLILGLLLTFQSSDFCFSADSMPARWIPVDDALLDARSGLEWTRHDNGHDIDWNHASRLCADLPGKWRLPSAEELLALYDPTAAGTSCGSARCQVSEAFDLTGEWFWSSEPVGNDGSDGNELSWGVLLVNGARTKAITDLGENSRALCVRKSAGAHSRAAKPEQNSEAALALPLEAGHTAVVFSWSHRGFSHPLARLEQIKGSLVWDRANLADSSVQVTLPLEGLHTGNEALDKRLRGKDFFEAVTYPDVTFKSTAIVPHPGSDQFDLLGALTIHGVTKPVTLLAKINKTEGSPGADPWIGFDADGSLRRSEFGLSRYVPVVSDQIAIHITLEAHHD